MPFIPIRWREDKVLIFICLFAFISALAFNFAIIPGYGPDEPRHLAYIRLLFEERTLPRVLSSVPYSEYKGAHAFHPPFYYTVLLPFYVIGRSFGDANLTHFLRFFSGLLCLLSLPLLYDVALLASNQKRNIARLATAIVAFVPMFGMTAGTLNNDAGAFALASLFLWLLLWKWRHKIDFKTAILLGVVLGLGGLSKATALLVGIVAILIWAVVNGRESKNWGKVLTFALTVLVVGALVVSPWHIRSFNLYGTWNPLPPAAPWAQLPPPVMGKLLTIAHPDFPSIFLKSNFGMFYSLWSQRDWLGQGPINVPGFPPPLQTLQLTISLIFGLVATLAVAGHISKRKSLESEVAVENKSAYPVVELQNSKRKSFESEIPVENKSAFYAPLAAFGAVWLTVLQVALFLHQGWAEGGRYLFPILIGFAIFLAVGLEKLLGSRFKAFAAVFVVFLISLDLLSLFWLLSYLNPTFGPK